MTMKQWESSAQDRALDKRLGFKEGSKEDRASDRKALAALNKNRANYKKLASQR